MRRRPEVRRGRAAGEVEGGALLARLGGLRGARGPIELGGSSGGGEQQADYDAARGSERWGVGVW